MDLFSSHIVSTTHQISLCRSFKYNCFRTSYSFIIFLAQSLSLGFIASSVQYVSIIRSLRLALWLDSFSSLFPVSHQLDRSLRLALWLDSFLPCFLCRTSWIEACDLRLALRFLSVNPYFVPICSGLKAMKSRSSLRM